MRNMNNERIFNRDNRRNMRNKNNERIARQLVKLAKELIGANVPSSLKKFVPKDLKESISFINIPSGAIGFDIMSKRGVKPKYRFNSAVKVKSIGTVTRGSGEWQKTDYVIVLPAELSGGEDRLLQVPETSL